MCHSLEFPRLLEEIFEDSHFWVRNKDEKKMQMRLRGVAHIFEVSATTILYEVYFLLRREESFFV
jgi:hypothetical protein